MHFVVSQSCSQEGAVEIFGTVTDTLIAGRLEICVGGIWRAVYDYKWATNDVRLVCGERGFLPECNYSPLQHNPSLRFTILNIDAVYCRSSCFGSSDRPTGYTDFICSEASQLADCKKKFVDNQLPENNAGIICSKSVLRVQDGCYK